MKREAADGEANEPGRVGIGGDSGDSARRQRWGAGGLWTPAKDVYDPRETVPRPALLDGGENDHRLGGLQSLGVHRNVGGLRLQSRFPRSGGTVPRAGG